jgi:4-hydroxybenzoate polyprenyltransferase
MGLSGETPIMSLLNFSLLVLATLLIASGGYIINDYFDIEIDKINKPEKRIIGKMIPEKRAMNMYWIITILGNVIGFYLAFRINYLFLGFIFPLTAIMLWYYSSRFQKTVVWGNLMISLLSAMVILIVWLFEFFTLRNTPIIYINVLSQIKMIGYIVASYAVFAYLVTLIREIVKDIEDREGDQKGNYKTLAIVFGSEKAKWVAIIIHITAVLFLAVLQYYLYMVGLNLVFWYLLAAVQSLFLFVLYYLLQAKTKEDFHFISNALKIIMVAGILSMQIFYISYS